MTKRQVDTLDESSLNQGAQADLVQAGEKGAVLAPPHSNVRESNMPPVFALNQLTVK